MDNLAILLCTYNGEKFLQEQLKSFSKQSFKNWHLFIYDDGSTDNTKNLVLDNLPQDKFTFVSNNTALGCAKNFFNGLTDIPANFDFYALSDQDDIWLEHKLQHAVSCLKTLDNKIPSLYCSRSTIVDSVGTVRGESPLFQKKPSFNNALVQSIAGGNTMVLNRVARNLVVKAGRNLSMRENAPLPHHDWFIYQLITGAGGIVYYDSHSEILYRQHDSNLMGSNNGFSAKILRIKMVLNNSFRTWNNINVKALQNNSTLLTAENVKILNIFVKSRKSSLVPRLIGFLKCGIYRQTFCGNIALFIAGMFNKV